MEKNVLVLRALVINQIQYLLIKKRKQIKKGEWEGKKAVSTSYLASKVYKKQSNSREWGEIM